MAELRFTHTCRFCQLTVWIGNADNIGELPAIIREHLATGCNREGEALVSHLPDLVADAPTHRCLGCDQPIAVGSSAYCSSSCRNRAWRKQKRLVNATAALVPAS